MATYEQIQALLEAHKNDDGVTATICGLTVNIEEYLYRASCVLNGQCEEVPEEADVTTVTAPWHDALVSVAEYVLAARDDRAAYADFWRANKDERYRLWQRDTLFAVRNLPIRAELIKHMDRMIEANLSTLRLCVALDRGEAIPAKKERKPRYIIVDPFWKEESEISTVFDTEQEARAEFNRRKTTAKKLLLVADYDAARNREIMLDAYVDGERSDDDLAFFAESHVDFYREMGVATYV